MALTYSDLYSENKNIQFSDESTIKKLQLELLNNHINYCIKNSEYYKSLFRQNGIEKWKALSLSDIKQLPFTDKEDLNARNWDFMAVDRNKVTDICLTSASTGNKPTSIALTTSDLNRLAYNENGAFDICGLTNNDTAIVACGLGGAFMAGIAYFLGGVSKGITMVRGGAASTAQIINLIQECSATVLIGVPSFFKKIAIQAEEDGIEPVNLGIKKLIAIGEPVRDSSLNLLPVANYLEKSWGAKIYSTYASSEMAASFVECGSQEGGAHIQPELIITELLDENGNEVEAGQPGELVVTPLGVTGMPLVRFKTGDILFRIESECSCGRKTERYSPVIGRKNQMIKYKGTTVYPSLLLSALEGDNRFYGAYIELSSFEDGSDRVILKVSLNDKSINSIKVGSIVKSVARVTPEIEIISCDELDTIQYQADKRKRVTFIDKRSK